MKELAESNKTLGDSRSDLMASDKNTGIKYRKFRNSVACKKSYMESKSFLDFLMDQRVQCCFFRKIWQIYMLAFPRGSANPLKMFCELCEDGAIDTVLSNL